jgi:hypothetical protein
MKDQSRSAHLLNRSALTALAVVLTACQTMPRISTPEKQHSEAQGTKVTEVIVQNGINKEFPLSNTGAAAAGAVAGIPGLGLLLAAAAGAAGGAVDAGVNASRAKTAEEEVQPLRAALVDYNFDQRLKQAVDDKLQTLSWLKAQPTEVVKDPKTKIDAASTLEPQLYLLTSYSVAPDFGALHVRVFAQQLPQQPAAPVAKKQNTTTSHPKKAAPIYRNTILFTAKLPSLTAANNVQRLEAWKAADAETRATRIRNILDRAANEIGAALALDMALDQDAVKEQLADKKLADYHDRPKGPKLGKVVAQVADQTVIRNNDGSLTVTLQL